MKCLKLMNLGLLLAALTAGCGPQPTAPTTGDKKGGGPEDKNDHGKGPNGGVILDLGKGHAEFNIDHAKPECSVVFIDGDDQDAKPMAVAAKDLVVSTKATKTKDGTAVPAMTIKLTAQNGKDGKAERYTGTDPGLKHVVDHSGSVAGEVDGKPASGKFVEK